MTHLDLVTCDLRPGSLIQEPEVENAWNLGVLGGRRRVGAERWELGIHGRILKVYPSKASTNVLCELVGAFELSGGKNEIVAIILRLTSDSHLS